ncbi:hypothetical protein PTSG_03634 [Salpingoeca rosetta]|uniref:ShKT domain-containing protein n=1 Tax=Salpingoeca rosetta (strain ATCC 50818 / BSB-021) TaxID=946362 RepID=F2U657_SALR5|nr:uncharacterized protein PTSG_03634 [Salpingoeca rosetta]EGD82998.1 hypothetical protein PTSG_03634 [Salpingoeca rosetta]|eukprot:XP_004995362.1 hypothetical protein PTSG_03634 [Salpingoeca rosetta]
MRVVFGMIVATLLATVVSATLDQDDALAALLPSTGTCTEAAQQGLCGAFANAVAFLCQQSCQGYGYENACMDQDLAVEQVWQAGVSDLGAQEQMTCERTRRALHCNMQPFASLCPQTCLKCVDNQTQDEYGDAASVEALTTFAYQEELIKQEMRQARYECALQRQAADYDCATQQEPCPAF